jgi:hypothetical protein
MIAGVSRLQAILAAGCAEAAAGSATAIELRIRASVVLTISPCLRRTAV